MIQVVMDSTLGNVQDIQDFVGMLEGLFEKLMGNKFAGSGPRSINEIRLNCEMILAASRNPSLKKIVIDSSEKQMEILTALIQKLISRQRCTRCYRNGTSTVAYDRLSPHSTSRRCLSRRRLVR